MKSSSFSAPCAVVALVLLPWPSQGSRQAQDAARAHDDGAPGLVIRWTVPLHQFPMLGFHPTVDLDDSALAVDRLVSARPFNTYNCHFYTKAFVEGSDRDLVDIESINDLYLVEHGFRRNDGPARVGDIVIAIRRPESLDKSSEVTHSGVVTAVDEAGRILTIRQKFNPTEPVVDLDLTDFISLYAGKHPWTWSVWSRGENVTCKM